MKITEVTSDAKYYDHTRDELTRSELMMIIQILVKNGGHQKKIRKLGIMMDKLGNET